MTQFAPQGDIVESLDAATAALVRLSARVTAGREDEVRDGLAECGRAGVPARWVEELILQSYLFAGFPRALNAAREWRKTGHAARKANGTGDRDGETYGDVFEWRLRGEETCSIVYGEFYEKLRGNIRGLHEALDEWMIVEGYGKVLSRDGLDLARRELCVVAACVAAGQDRQAHSHLHGARHARASDSAITATLDALEGIVEPTNLARARGLWGKVRAK